MIKIVVVCASDFALAFLSAAALGTELTPILPLDSPTVIGSSEPFPGGVWSPTNLLDGKPQTEFAVKSQGVGTHVDFDFGKPVVEVHMTDIHAGGAKPLNLLDDVRVGQVSGLKEGSYAEGLRRLVRYIAGDR